MKQRLPPVILLMLGLLMPLALAQTLWAGEEVREILVQGNQRVEKEAILGAIGSRVGFPYSAEQVRRDLRALYRMGIFEDVRIERESVAGGVRLFYILQEKSKIARIGFDGNKKVKEEKLRELITLKAYTSIDSSKIADAVRKIQEHYAREGYHLAQVSAEFKPVAGSADRELLFRIREGEGVRIRRVNFIGNRFFSDRELRKQLKNREKGYFSWLTSRGKYQEEIARRDTAFLAYHYQNHGFLKVKVTPPRITLSRDRRWIALSFRVEEGKRYKIREVGIEGDLLTTREELLSKMKARGGDLYSRKNLEEDLSLLSQLYGDQGYAFANINPVIKPHDEEDPPTADIFYSIQRGSKVIVEKINISGNEITRDKVIRRELLIKENTLYNETRLRESQKRVEALGFFEEVNFATPRGSADDRIQINITVKEKPTGTFSVGVGFSSVENFIFTASIAKNNFFGFGVSGQFSTQISSKRQLFLLSFEDPYFLDSNWLLGLSGFRTIDVFGDFDRRSFGGSMSLGHRLFDYSTFRLGYQIEDVNVGRFRTVVPTAFSQNLSGLTSSLSLSLQRDTRNNRLFPSKGTYNIVSVEGAGVGGDNKFLRMSETFRFYQPLWKSIVGKFNFQIAQISSLTDQPVPLFERYFLGGVNSLRGYFLRSIGPSVQIPGSPQGGDNLFVFGGNRQLQFNTEVEFPLYDPAGFRLVSFFDAGNAYSEETKFDIRDLRYDYGFGLRWHSPLGPLRFEWGIPIHRRTGEDSVVFNFTIGSFF